MAERPLYTLYKGLKANNYDVPSSYDSFEKTLVEAGNGGANARHTLFNSLKSQGYDVPDTYESFYRTLFTPINKTTSRAIGGYVPMSEADKRRFSAGAANISAQARQTMQNAGRYNKLKNRQKKQKNDFGRVNIGTHQTPYGSDAENVVKDDFAYNPETGKAGTYVNSDSDDAYNLAEAEQKQAALDQQNQAYQEAVNAGDIPSVFDVRDKTGNYDLQENVGKDGTYVTEEGAQKQFDKKLVDAYARKKEIEAAIAEDNRLHGNPLLSYSASIGASNGRTAEQSDYRNKLVTSLALVTEQIGSLEAVKKYPTSSWGEDVLKALDNTIFTAKTWDFGLTDLAAMGQMERIKTKMDNNIPLSGSDKMLLKSKLGADAAAALEDEKMGNIYRWTKIAGQSLPFMLDFFLTGGYGGITKGISSGALKFAAKRGMGKVSAAILKNTGIVAGDVIGSYAMAGTEQALKTGADIMQRHLGNLYQDENGNYKFGTFDENGNLLHEGGEGMGKALYKGMTAAMLENYTEKIFGHNYGLKKGALRFMENHGMARSAEFFKNIGQKEWYAGSKKWMEKFGINGFAEEVMEEEINIPLNALLVGDNKASDLLDPKQQMDIIGGMALSVGSMYALGAGTRPLKGVYNRAQYYRYKNKVDSSDTDAYTAFGSNDAEKWESLRDKIDNAPNEKMGGVLASIIASRDELTKDQIDAAVHYGINLMKMRGYNLAKTEEMNAKEMTGETATPEEQHDEEVETAYSEGHDAENADKHNIQMEAEDQMTTLAGMLGITEQQLSGMTDEELESLTGQDDKLDQAIYDYQLSTARYQGVVDNATDKVEAAARQASHQTDMLTDKSRGTVRNATVIGINGEEDYGVYIISGKLATHEDGAINIGDSDSMIIYYDPKTQSVEHADARRFVALGDEVPAEEVKALAIADAKETAIKAEAGIIDGTVEAGTQFSTTDADGSEHTYEVLADNGDGTAMITIDGNVEQNPYTFEELQTLKDAEDLKRLNAAKAQRGMKEEQRAQQQKEDEQKNAILEQITNADGNVVLVDVIDADGNTRYPGSQVFLVSNDGAKAKVMEMDAEGNLKPHAVNKEDITEISTMSQDEFKQTLPASNIEEDRGEIEVEETEPEPIGKGVFGNVYDQFKGKVKAAFDFLLKHKGGDLLGVFHRDDVGDIDLVWGDKTKNQGIDHIIDKHIEQHNDFASVDEAISVIDDVINNGAINEKKSKWDKVVIEKDGYSVVIRKNLRDDKGNVVDNSKNWVVTAFESEHKQGEKKVSSDATLAAPSINEGSRAVAPDETSDGKGTNNSAENNENNETLTLEDGTVVPMLEDGNPDFSQLTAEQTAELYDSQFGEDAEQIISGFVSEAKKALDKATNMSVNGKNFAEQKASKADKDKAVADAQTAYDSAKAISDAYAERQLSKETDTHEGRMNLIQKAKNKYARLKNKEEWKNNPFALWNETVGKVLHRLYDGASVDVFDHEPQTVEEYVSSNIAPYSLNFEGKENSKGVAAETGLQRKDFAKSRVLAAEGKGKTVDEFVHKLWEDRPKQLENVSDQEIRNALLSLITSDMNAYDMSHVIEDNRIAQAEEELENNKRAAENAAFEEEQRKAAEEETKKQEEEAKKQAEVAAKPEEEAKAAATAEETGKLDEEMADANDEYEHLAPSYNFENDENLSEEERENMVLRDGDTFAEYRNRNGVDANGTTTPLGIKVARAYIQQKYGDKLADIDAIFGMPMKDHYDGWLMAEQMMKIVDADMNDFDAALLMKNDNVPLSSEAILGYMDGAAELIKARQDAEKLGLAAFDSAGNPVYKSIIELANWAKEQGLEVDGESVASNYANLYLACKDGFGATTLVPDNGELINMVFYFPGQLIGENGVVNQERLRQMADEFNEGRDALHSAEADIELTDGAQFYNGDTAREFRDFVDKKTEEENKPFGEQIDESELPFSVKEGKGKKYDRAADVEKNHVSGMEVVDAVVGRKTRKAFDRLAKMMGAKIQWQYSDKMGNGWYDEKVNEDGSVERTIYLTLDSSIMEGAQFIFGHEMTHEMKSKNPTDFDELKNLIINTYGKEAFDKAVDETEKRYRDAGVNYAGGRAAYEEEVVADGIGEMIRDLNLAHTLALKMSHPLLAYLHEILQKIKRAFYGTEYSDKMKEVIRGIEQAYVKTAKGNFEAESGEAREEVAYSLREKEEPKKKGIGYKVFLLGKDGKLYPPMVANPNGAATPVGVWLDADAAPIAGESKTGRPQVKQGGKGTQGGSGKLAYRPGWHLGVIPYALQFNRKDAEGNKTLFPKNFVFAEVEYAADVDYQQEAHDAGINPSGKYQHSLAGLKHLPTDGYYMYRTNPNPETDPWVITGAMKVNRILTRAEQAELVKNAGREPQQIQEGDIVTDDVVNSINQEIADAPKFSLKVYHGSGADFTEFDFDHMGEGAGSQTFGWGGYVTSSKKIGKSYANIVDANAPHQDVEYVGNNAHEYTDVVAGLFNGGQRDYDDVQEFLQNGYNSDKDNARKKQMLEWFESTKPSDWKSVNDGKRNLYEVDIPDDNGNNYLDFENPMNEEQINTIRDALVKNGIDVSSWEKRGFKLDLPFKDVYAAVLPMMMRCEPKEVSKFLSSLGYTGIKYPAGTIMGGAEEGDTNYVIFKPEDMQITKHTKFSLKNAKPVRFEVGKSLSEDEKKEVLATLKDAYKENNVSFHTEESANGKERRVYEPTAEDYVKSDITGRALRYYITLPDGHIAHPTEVYPNISNNEVETSLKKRDVLGDEVKELIDSNVNKLRDSVTDKDKVVAILKQLQDLQHETTDVGYGLDNPQSYNYKTGVFTSNANQAIDYVVRRMRRKEEVPADVVDAVKTAVKDSFGMVDNLIDGITADAAPKTFEEILESPSLKFQIRNEEQRKAAESAYNWAVENRPDNWKRYALVNMERPNQMPEYYEKKKLADEWRRFYNKDVHDDWGASLRKPWGNYKLFDLNKPFEENVVNVKGKVPEEFDPHKFEKNRAEIGAINKQQKELEAKLNALEEVRRTRNNDILKQYMDEHQLSSENEVPDDVWMNARKTAYDEYTAEADKVIDQMQELNKKLKALSGNEVRYSLKDTDKTLAGVHNITEEKLLKAIKMGGLANPSVAVIDSSKQKHEVYGEISLILPSDKVAKRTGKNAGTWQGDAYTPTYPEVEKQMSNKGAEKSSSDVLSVPKEMQHEVRNGIDRWLNGGDANSGLKYLFLHEKGVAPEPKMIQPKFSDEAYNELKNITAGDFNILGIGKADTKKVLDMYIEAKFDGDKALYEEKTKAWLERNKTIVDAGIKGGMRYAIAKENVELYNKYGFNYNGVQTFVRDVEYDHRKTGVDTNATLNEAEYYIKTNNLTDEFNTWLEGKEKEYGIKEVIFDGFTPSGNRRYVPNTLENVSKVMKKQGRNGATGAAVSFQNFAARLMPSYGTLKDIRSKKGLLTSDREKFDKFRDKWSSVFFELGNKCQPDSTSAFDSYGMERLSEAAMTSDPQAYLKKEYNVDFSDADTKRLKDMVKAIKEEHPAMYFETKFERPVGFDEFSSAVVPTTTKKEVKEALKNAGVSIFEYDEKSDADRSRAFNEAINSSENIRFSLAGERGAAAADKADERTFRMDNLSVAKDMEKNKKKAKAIKVATGWERGADGKWRYEMPDVVFRDPKEWVNKKTLTLSDIVEKPNDLFKEYPELFDAYPELKDMKILKGRAKSGGVFYNNAITLNLGDIREAIKYDMDTHYKLANNSLKKTLVHEIQHYIQDKEGFAQGGNSEMIIDKNALDAIAKLRAEKDAVAKEFYAISPEEQQRRKYEINNRYNDLTKQIERLEKSSRIGYDGYNRLSGEVEARNVSARLNMTPEERRKSLAESTEDVARKDQIFLGVGDVSFSIRDMANGKESGAADMAEDLKSLNTPDEVDDAIKTAIDDMPSGWKMANKKMIHIAQALGENRKAEIAGEEPKFSLKDGTLIKAGTYFSGGGLVEEGLKGIIDPVVAVEYDEKISGVYRNNFGLHIVTADVRDVDPRELVKQIDGEVEYFHASPVCKNYSQAKSNHAEVELDKETAASTADFINAVKPKVVTIENVKGYKDSDAMKTITDALDANGYTWDADVYNAADYGGYTNRERLIVRAVRDGQLPAKPKKMERKSGWYEAVADIIPTLTEKKNGVANWMDVRLKADGIDWRNIDKPLYVMGSAYADGKVPHAFADELLPTLRTKSGDVIVMPDGKVYRAMGRVLARVSGVSDDYKMPFSESLSHTIIGNGIPTQLTEQVIAPLVQNTLRPTPEDGNTKFSLRYEQFEHDLNQWKKDNGLKKDAQRPAIPTRDPGESAVDFMKKVNEYRRQMALWKTAPTYEGHLLTDGTALGEFNRELQRGSVLKRIAFQDSMLAIRKAQEAIMKEHGLDKISMAEDAYTAENRSHGKGKNELEEYNDEFLQPLRKAYKKMKDLMDGSYDNVKVYMMAKHGLERNAHIAFKKALENDFENVDDRVAAYNGYKADVARMQNDADLNNGKIDYVTWRQIDNGIRTKYAPSYPEYRYDKDGNIMDYSGLTALFEGMPDIEVVASDLVKNAEDKYSGETADLWNAVNAATKKILRDSYKAGMMSEKVYEYVRDMYKNYIPLRGWNETQADQVWDYIGGGKGAFNQTLKEANGRTSIADDPIAYIENMAESGILINNKNWVKQHLMLLAENHHTSLLTLSKAWYVKSTDAAGNETWIPASPQITSGMTNQQVEAAMEVFQKKMEKLEETGDATQQRGHLEITYPQTNSEEREHEVRVMKDGEEYVIYVNGDPQLAQAMNNTRAHRVREVQSGKLDRACAWLGRKMAAAYTSLSPLFIPSNYFRDLTMTLASTAIREDGRYNYLLRKNMATSWNMWGLLKGYKDGSLREKVRNGKSTEKEQMFYDFMMNGGETGFVSSFDVEDLKKKFKGELKDMDRWAANPKKVLHTIYDSIEFMNRSIENSNRFAIYMTSIQYGRSIEEAVNNAKDVTLNFNRKGTGENGWQMIRNLYLFINPAVQSLQTLGALVKHHPFKFTAVTASWLASGVLVPIVNAALMSLLGGDDDKDKYWQFTKWDRRNNLIMWIPFTHEYIKIPLAQEFRAFYGVGDMIASMMMGGELAEESWSQYAEDLLGQVVDMLPLDPTGYDGNIAVSLMPNAIRPVFELAFNVDFTGKPLFKETEYNKYDPNFTKAYVGTPDWLVRASRMVNSIGNDYPDVQQNSIDAFGDPRYNLNNPAVVDHVLSSYLGGAYTMGSQVLGVLTKSLNDPKEIKVADIPLFSKFVSNPDDRPVTKKQGDEFWNMKENHDRAANTLSKLKKQAKVDGDYSMLERFYGSEDYKQYKQDDVKVKKYEEDKKKERAEESGEEYRPHKLNAEDIYKAHATPKDDFEDLKLKQLYTKLNGFKTSYDLLVDTAPSQSDGYYNTNKAAIDAIDEISLDKQEISELKKGFLDDGKDAYNAEDMNQIRDLRKKILAVLEKANKVVVANQKANAKK